MVHSTSISSQIIQYLSITRSRQSIPDHPTAPLLLPVLLQVSGRAPDDQESNARLLLMHVPSAPTKDPGLPSLLSSPLGRAPALLSNATQVGSCGPALSPTEVASFPLPSSPSAPRPLPPTHLPGLPNARSVGCLYFHSSLIISTPNPFLLIPAHTESGYFLLYPKPTSYSLFSFIVAHPSIHKA